MYKTFRHLHPSQSDNPLPPIYPLSDIAHNHQFHCTAQRSGMYTVHKVVSPIRQVSIRYPTKSLLRILPKLSIIPWQFCGLFIYSTLESIHSLLRCLCNTFPLCMLCSNLVLLVPIIPVRAWLSLIHLLSPASSSV